MHGRLCCAFRTPHSSYCMHYCAFKAVHGSVWLTKNNQAWVIWSCWQAGRQAGWHTGRQTGRQVDQQTGLYTSRYVDKHACRQAGLQLGKLAQAERQTSLLDKTGGRSIISEVKSRSTKMTNFLFYFQKKNLLKKFISIRLKVKIIIKRNKLPKATWSWRNKRWSSIYQSKYWVGEH